MKSKTILYAVLIPVLLVIAPFARATDQSDLSIALKTLPLLTNKIAGSASVGIVYSPASAESKSDAEAIKALFDGGVVAPENIHLTAQLVGTDQLSRLSGDRMVFLARQIPHSEYESVSAAASAAGALTICTDLEPVRLNKCILGVVSKPHVEIYYSPVAAEKAGVGFASAFTMLAKQVGSM